MKKYRLKPGEVPEPSKDKSVNQTFGLNYIHVNHESDIIQSRKKTKPMIGRLSTHISLGYILPIKFKKSDVLRLEDSLNGTSYYKVTKQKTNKKEGTTTLTLEPIK